jgi:hypothetical protein
MTHWRNIYDEESRVRRDWLDILVAAEYVLIPALSSLTSI